MFFASHSRPNYILGYLARGLYFMNKSELEVIDEAKEFNRLIAKAGKNLFAQYKTEKQAIYSRRGIVSRLVNLHTTVSLISCVILCFMSFVAFFFILCVIEKHNPSYRNAAAGIGFLAESLFPVAMFFIYVVFLYFEVKNSAWPGFCPHWRFMARKVVELYNTGEKRWDLLAGFQRSQYLLETQLKVIAAVSGSLFLFVSLEKNWVQPSASSYRQLMKLFGIQAEAQYPLFVITFFAILFFAVRQYFPLLWRRHLEDPLKSELQGTDDKGGILTLH